MKHQELGNFSDVLFYLEGHGITKETAKEIALRLFGWGVDAAIDRMRPSRPEVPDDVPEIEAMKHAQLSMLGDTANRKSEPKKPAAPRQVARPWPSDFRLDEDLTRFARERGFDQQNIERMWERFRDRNQSRGEKYVDWKAAWRTWVNNQVEFRNRDSGNRPPVTDGRI